MAKEKLVQIVTLTCPSCGEERQGRKTQYQSSKRLCEPCRKNKVKGDNSKFFKKNEDKEKFVWLNY